MQEPKKTENQLQASQILKEGVTFDVKEIDSSSDSFYNTVKEEVKRQQDEMRRFNELDEDQLRFVVQL